MYNARAIWLYCIECAYNRFYGVLSFNSALIPGKHKMRLKWIVTR